MAYFIIVTRETPTDPWAVQFGDYDRDVVTNEVEDSYHDYRKSNVKVVKVNGAWQRNIDAAVAKLNGKG